MARLLIDSGCLLDAVDSYYGISPLEQFAIETPRYDILDVIIEAVKNNITARELISIFIKILRKELH